MLRSRASGCFLALGGCVGVKVLYDCVFQALGPCFSVIIIQQHTAVVRVVSSIDLSGTAVVLIVIVNFQSFGPSVPYLCYYIILQHNTAVLVVVIVCLFHLQQ